jgi:hypothetical protein
MKKFLFSIIFAALFIDVHAQTPTQINNELTFARLYGYVRYFYPGDEAAGIDWNRFAIYGSKQVADCSSSKELKNTLNTLFKPIAPTIQIGYETDDLVFDKSQLTPANLNGYKTIAWQHVGVGLLKDKRSLYKSARTNRSIVYASAAQTFGSITTSVDAGPYRGDEFKLTGRAKMVSGTGNGHFWLRVDKTNKKTGFFDNMQNRPILTTEWKNFEITGKIDTDANDIYMGIFLLDDGELWMDDFTLSVNKDGKWITVYTNNLNNEKTGISQTGILNNPYNGKPGPNHNDYIYSIVQDDKNPAEKWASIKSKRTPADYIEAHTTYFDKYPQVGEYINKNIGNGLKVIVPLALYGDDKRTYPATDSTQFWKLIKELNTVKNTDITGDQLNTRLGDIIITWNVFQHFFPYFDFANTDWAQDFRDATASAYNDKTADDFQKTLAKLTAKLKDGHIAVDRVTGNTDRFWLPIGWDWAEGKLVITRVLNDSVAIQRGDIVTAINGEDPAIYFKNAEQYISAATPGYLNARAINTTLRGPNAAPLSLTATDKNGSSHTITLSHNLSLSAYRRAMPVPDTVKSLGDGITYLNINVANHSAIDAAMPLLQKSRVIICDLRVYPADDGSFIQHLLTQKDTAAHYFQIPRFIYPDRENLAGYEVSGTGFEPLSPHLNAKIIFLTSNDNISYAESYLMLIKHYKLATLVGQTTAGTNGNTNTLQLPGGYVMNFTGMKVLNPDGSQHHGIGIKPDICVNKTIQGISAGKDETLEKAIALAKSYN